MRFANILASTGLGLALFASVATAQTVRTINLPPEVAYPEGIAYDPDGPYIYTASALDGAVARVNLSTGQSQIVAKPGVLGNPGTTFPAFLGMKLDAQKRLWIAGGRTPSIHILDTRSGALVRTVSVPTTGLLNDLVVTPDAIFVTDTLQPTLWRIPVNGDTIGTPEAWLDLKDAMVYGQGAGVNGIAKTADNRTLILVHMSRGLLYKVDVASKRITPINTGGADLTGADGLELDGNHLYVIRQPAGEPVGVQLNADLTSGQVVQRLTGNPALVFPATAVKVGNELLVISTQFNRRAANEAVRPFSIVAIPVSLLGGK